MALHETGSNNPDGIEIKKQPKDPKTGLPLDGIFSHPYYTVKDLVGVIVFLAVFSVIMFFVPDMGGYFLEANNFIPADPLKTPEHIAPVWYFTPYYAMLRAVPSFFNSQFWGVLVMGVAVLIFFFLPWLDRGAVKSIRYRGGAVQVVARGVRDLVPDPRLPRRRAGDGVGPVRRRLPDSQRRRQGDRRRARADGRLLPVLPADALVHAARQDQAVPGPGDDGDEALARIAAAFAVARPSPAPGLPASRRRRSAPRAGAASTASTTSRCSAARATSSTTASTATRRSTCGTTG